MLEIIQLVPFHLLYFFPSKVLCSLLIISFSRELRQSFVKYFVSSNKASIITDIIR